MTTVRLALPAGTRVEEYRIQHVLGSGGFGITYLAEDEFRRPVVIKEYLPADFAVRDRDSSVQPRSDDDAAAYEWGLTRFWEEAKILARFDHPNIVKVLRRLEANNTAYFVMPYEEGEDLRKLLRRRGTLT